MYSKQGVKKEVSEFNAKWEYVFSAFLLFFFFNKAKVSLFVTHSSCCSPAHFVSIPAP